MCYIGKLLLSVCPTTGDLNSFLAFGSLTSTVRADRTEIFLDGCRVFSEVFVSLFSSFVVCASSKFSRRLEKASSCSAVARWSQGKRA